MLHELHVEGVGRTAQSSPKVKCPFESSHMDLDNSELIECDFIKLLASVGARHQTLLFPAHTCALKDLVTCLTLCNSLNPGRTERCTES